MKSLKQVADDLRSLASLLHQEADALDKVAHFDLNQIGGLLQLLGLGNGLVGGGGVATVPFVVPTTLQLPNADTPVVRRPDKNVTRATPLMRTQMAEWYGKWSVRYPNPSNLEKKDLMDQMSKHFGLTGTQVRAMLFNKLPTGEGIAAKIASTNPKSV